jgi:UDP-glucose 4-epimerase
MARCIVTGHKGYIGSRVYKKLKDLGHEVRGIDLVEGTDINSLQGFAEDNDGNFHPSWKNFKPEYIFHLACIPRVGYSVEEPVKTMANNVMAGTNVLNFARKVGAKRVIYSSSSSIRGDGSGPTSPYGLQKMVTEVECQLYTKLYDLDTVSLRYFNVYSKDQTVDGPYATAVANWMHYIRLGKSPFITGDGEQRRDMLHVEDAVSANIFAMDRKEDFEGAVLDVGTGNNISLNEVKDIVLEAHPNVKFEYVDDRPGDVMYTQADTEKLKNLGWQVEINIQDGIKNCFRSL